MCRDFDIDYTIPVEDIPKEQMDIILHGTDKKFRFDFESKEFSFHGMREFRGIVKNMEKRYYETFSDSAKEEIENRFMIEKECKVCHGED